MSVDEMRQVDRIAQPYPVLRLPATVGEGDHGRIVFLLNRLLPTRLFCRRMRVNAFVACGAAEKKQFCLFSAAD
jgi:hypothetical protein